MVLLGFTGFRFGRQVLSVCVMPSLGVWAWKAAIGRHDASRVFLLGVALVKVCTFFVGGARALAGCWLLRPNPSFKRDWLTASPLTQYVRRQKSHGTI